MSKYAFLFPGQGAQHPGMGKALYDAFPQAKAVFDEADEALGRPLSQLCFEGSEAELALTKNTQPAILTHSIAVLRVLAEEHGVECTVTAGHSLGEYSAHVAAGTLSFADAVKAVEFRGRAMQEAVPAGQGSMAAIIGLDLETIEEICQDQAQGDVLSPANLNAPGQIVIAGTKAAVDRAVPAATAAGAKKAIPLNVSAPFHCALMKPAELELATYFNALSFNQPQVAVVSNVDATAVTDAEHAKQNLITQVCAPVRWIDCMQTILGMEVQTCFELGPGRVLSGLMKRIDRRAQCLAISDPESLEKSLSTIQEATS